MNGKRMIQIQPHTETDGQLQATQLEVSTENFTDVSVDIVWKLYDANGGYVNDGRYQLGGDDYAAYQADNNYAERYVMAQKSIAVA